MGEGKRERERERERERHTHTHTHDVAVEAEGFDDAEGGRRQTRCHSLRSRQRGRPLMCLHDIQRKDCPGKLPNLCFNGDLLVFVVVLVLIM